jgi:uncharacterized membrane protein (UPF0127 family)
VRAVLQSSGKDLARDVAVASSLAARMRGLLGRSSLPEGHGLLIVPCKGIHTFFMNFSIDAVFLDRENRVVALYRSLRPNRITRIYPQAFSVLELSAGALAAEAVIGDVIDFS